RHYRMNLPNSTFRHVLSTIRLIFGRVPDIPKCLADYCDDRRFVDRKFSRRADVQRESCSRQNSPTKNRCDPNGIRTRVTAVKGRCPRPLDDRVGSAAISELLSLAQGKSTSTR